MLPHQLHVMSTANVPAPETPEPFSALNGKLPVIELLWALRVSVLPTSDSRKKPSPALLMT